MVVAGGDLNLCVCVCVFPVKLGMKWLTKCRDMLKPINDKWKHFLPCMANPQWKVIQYKHWDLSISPLRA